jgi:hypothetical protein
VGDHLHYEVVIGEVSVTPVEWWDAKWIRDHIGRPLQEASVLAPVGVPPGRSKERPAAPAKKPPRRARARI